MPKTLRDRPRRLPAEQRKETILGAALEVFRHTGYGRTRVSDIAARIGVTPPVIFQNFGTKAELFVAVLDRAADEAASAFAAMAEQADDAFVVLTHILDPAHFAEMHAQGAPGALFADAAAIGDDRITVALCRAISRFATPMTELLARGQREGTVRQDVAPVTLTWLILSLIRSRAFRVAVLPDGAPIEHELLNLTLDTLRPRIGSSSAPIRSEGATET